MEMDEYEHGTPSWVDLGTPDKDKAVAFYSTLFGWEVPPGTEETGFYSVAMLKGRAVAGIMPHMSPGPPVWSSYVCVDNADEIRTSVVEHGGAVIVEPMDVLDLGRMAFFSDPQGAAFGVWQPYSFPGAGIVNEPGAFSWTELVTTDVDAAKDFYGKVFGWGAETHGEGMTAYTEWKAGGRSIGGMMAKPPMMPAEVPPHWMVYFTVNDTDATADQIKALGGSVVMGPMDIEPGRFAVVTDPTGAPFSVITLNDDRAA